jgi:hypothetical protein
LHDEQGLVVQDSTANAGPLVALISQVCDTLLKSPSPKEEAAMMKALQSYVEACNKLNLVPVKLDEIQVLLSLLCSFTHGPFHD